MSEDPSVLILALGALCSDETVASLEEGDHVLGHQQGPECVDQERLNQGLRGHVGLGGGRERRRVQLCDWPPNMLSNI